MKKLDIILEKQFPNANVDFSKSDFGIDSVNGWDSLGHFNLLLLIEHEYKMQFSDDEMSETLQKEQRKGEFPFILHCFTGGQKLADIAIELGGFISVSGIITFKNAGDLRSVIKTVPIERLLIETDAPYLSPVPFRGARNEPANLIYTFDELLKIKDYSREELAFHTTDNFFRLFTKMPKSDTSIEKN